VIHLCVGEYLYSMSTPTTAAAASDGTLILQRLRTHLSMLSQDTDEVKLVEAQQHDQFVLGFAIVGRLLQTHTLQTDR